ncbi:bifunctional diguanylate cyclase/phosphodiesterase [Novosphingobium sp. AP12]|uniref:putative bifunctional diguanylate cyclase/phosphodiesterase n=1 Tax=Novosphingobium sp. AP12 TaxID=1144305 RepID=UPI00027223C7|nr:GGDEF domain-containing response regulator [Novosphingobium sp. AP12]EJL32055.1 diguanylate cyclase (GGDEF) domain-containing protein [Novosphingobium sp. AP12]
MDHLHNGTQNIHALIVDDDDVDRERLVRMLRRGPREITVEQAGSQAEALEKIRDPEAHFDIVFLDFGLADGDGRDLLPAIRGEIDPDCPIIAVTGNADEQIAADSIKSGMTEYLTKRSLSPERVAASVEEGMAWRQYRHDLRRQEEELTHRSLHDPLTDLPNRTLFSDRLGQACARARRSGDPFAVVMVDLDRFKEINDNFGHASGDAVLVTIGRRLREHLREVDTTARLGGDEFAILLQNIDGEESAMAVATKLTELIEQPIVHGGRMLHVGASIGIALCPLLGFSPDGLLSAADEAMYEAKRGVDKAVLARGEDRPASRSLDQGGMLHDIERAIAARAFEWHWQPKVDMRDGQVLGFEALVRWTHPEDGPIPADVLIETVEQSHLLEAFTYLSLDVVLGEFAALQHLLGDAAICINVSARMLERPGFVSHVVETTARHKVDPARVMLELTETALIANPAQARRVIEQLHDHKISLAIDDFGAGFTSFGYLREFAVSEIKIDRSFISRFTESRFDQSLVHSLVVLCESLGIPLVAEGVENPETQAMLVAMGCTCGQGYGICRPMPYENVRGWLEMWNTERNGTRLRA